MKPRKYLGRSVKKIIKDIKISNTERADERKIKILKEK